jgi:hypothetical protein
MVLLATLMQLAQVTFCKGSDNKYMGVYKIVPTLQFSF